MDNLENFREKIDKIDSEIIELLRQRFELMPKIAAYKKERSIDIFQPEREKKMKKIRIDLSEQKGINIGFTEKIFDLILDESKNIQKKSLGK